MRTAMKTVSFAFTAAGSSRATRPLNTPISSSRLTRRQQEVAACIAQGLSNEQIAERLVLASGTAANHVEHILRRLGLRSRTEVAVWAVERGLFRFDADDES